MNYRQADALSAAKLQGQSRGDRRSAEKEGAEKGAGAVLSLKRGLRKCSQELFRGHPQHDAERGNDRQHDGQRERSAKATDRSAF